MYRRRLSALGEPKEAYAAFVKVVDHLCDTYTDGKEAKMNQEAIGKFISTCRKDKGLTQIQLAEKLNITNRAVSKWETGRSCPDASIMLKLCDILDITVNDLLSGERVGMEKYQKKQKKDQAQKNLLRVTINEQIHNMHKTQTLCSCIKGKSFPF